MASAAISINFLICAMMFPDGCLASGLSFRFKREKPIMYILFLLLISMLLNPNTVFWSCLLGT